MLPVMTVRDGWGRLGVPRVDRVGVRTGWANFGVRDAILPLFAAVVIGKEPWVAGMALGVFAAGNAVGLTVAGRMSDRLGRRPFIIGGLLVSGVATAVTGFATDLPMLVVLSVVAGVGAGALNPAQQAALADVVGRERNGGPALAAFRMSTDTGAIIEQILAGCSWTTAATPWPSGRPGSSRCSRSSRGCVPVRRTTCVGRGRSRRGWPKDTVRHRRLAASTVSRGAARDA